MADPRDPVRDAGPETFTKAPPAPIDEQALVREPIRARLPGEEPPVGLRLADTALRSDEDATGYRPALLAEPFADPYVEGAVRCNACAHRCVVRPGRAGICGVRENRGGTLYTTIFGRAITAHAEPIEKKPLYHVLPGSSSFSVATRGCSFHCDFCQNWEMAQGHRLGIVPDARDVAPDAVVAGALATGCASIAYTYVEPTVFLEYALATAERARAAGLANVFVTNGYQTPETLDLVVPLLDAANVDLKSFRDATYRRVCGARLAPVLDTIVELRRRGVWVEVTTLVIPGLNDGADELAAIAAWIAREVGSDTPWHVSRFYGAHRMRDVPHTPALTLARAVAAGRSAGLQHVYAGNAPEVGGEDTHCGACDALLIRRSGYRVVATDLVGGRCPRCGTPLAGIGLDAPVAATSGAAR